jgi:centractin
MLSVQHSLDPSEQRRKDRDLEIKDSCGICIDFGSRHISAGIVGEDAPELIMEVNGDRGKDDETDFISRVLETTETHLGCHLDAQPIVLSRPVRSTQNEPLLECLFERFDSPAARLMASPELAMYASGSTLGLLVDVGHQYVQLAPFYDGYVDPLRAVLRWDCGGGDVARRLQCLLREKKDHGVDIDERAAVDIVRRHAAVRETPEAGVAHLRRRAPPMSPNTGVGRPTDSTEAEPARLSTCSTQSDGDGSTSPPVLAKYELPDGRTLEVGGDDELQLCMEPLFDPAAPVSVPKLIVECLSRSAVDTRRDLFRQIFLSGGLTLVPGFVDRLQDDLVAMSPLGDPPRIIAAPERRFLTWIGGSIVGSLNRMLWVSREEWQEDGFSARRMSPWI